MTALTELQEYEPFRKEVFAEEGKRYSFKSQLEMKKW
jgi:hypothetical protein